MPTYEYKCEKCGRFQLNQRITEPALEVCPTCGGPVKRLISQNVGIIFKGSGFYITDNRSPSLKTKEESKSIPVDKKPAESKS